MILFTTLILILNAIIHKILYSLPLQLFLEINMYFIYNMFHI